MKNTILIVDSNPAQVKEIKALALDTLDYQIKETASDTEVIKMLKDDDIHNINLVLMAIPQDDIDVLGLIQIIKTAYPKLPVIFYGKNISKETTTQAIAKGASEVIELADDQKKLVESIDKSLHINQLNNELSRLTQSLDDRISFANIIGQSESIEGTITLAKKTTDTDIPVLIEGESGVGKELFARAIHGESKRSDGPFVAVNCAAIPENLVESILFGHEKGSFTGAASSTLGKFREANHGTLFLDEIGELHPQVQAKLLRALQENEIEPVGGKKPVKVDIRIISASNQNLEEQVQEHKFREDLYFRLNVFPILIPALRERRKDILPLLEHFCHSFSLVENKEVTSISNGAKEILMAYDWPGNVRQLKNVVFRAVVMCEGDTLTSDCLKTSLVDTKEAMTNKIFDFAMSSDPSNKDIANTQSISPLDQTGHIRTLQEIEEELINYAMARYNGQMSEVARRLGIGRSTLYRKIQEIEHPSFPSSESAS